MKRIAGIGAVLCLTLIGCGGDDAPSESQLTTAVDEVLSDCPVPDESIAQAVGEEIEFSTSTSSGTLADESGEFAVSYSGCTYTGAAGGSYDVAELVDAEGDPDPGAFDTIAAESDVQQLQGFPEDAVSFADEIHFRVGDHSYVVSGQDKDLEPIDPPVLEALAHATAASVAE